MSRAGVRSAARRTPPCAVLTTAVLAGLFEPVAVRGEQLATGAAAVALPHPFPGSSAAGLPAGTTDRPRALSTRARLPLSRGADTPGTLPTVEPHGSSDNGVGGPRGLQKHKGSNCLGSGPDSLRGFHGTSAQCLAKCAELGPVRCVGFIRINGEKSGNLDGQCFFRTGKLSQPFRSASDDRDCYAPPKVPRTIAPGYTGSWRPRPPCNVLLDSPAAHWGAPGRAASTRRDPTFVCRPAATAGREGPRRNRLEEKVALPWFDNTAVLCWSTNATGAARHVSKACRGGNVSCPSMSWYVRAGIGNRYFFVAAAAVQAEEMGTVAYIPTPLGNTGGAVPTVFGDAAAPKHFAGDCNIGRCVVPTEGEWGGEFGQGLKTTKGLARFRPRMCDLNSAPLLLMTEDAPLATDIVLHLRLEQRGDKLLGPPGITMLKAAVADARRNHGGVRLVVVSKLASHPYLDLIREAVGGFDQPQFTPWSDSDSRGRTPSSALRDMQFLSMARLLILSHSTFSFWGAYLSDSAEAIYFPVGYKERIFGRWCEAAEGFRGRDVVRYVTESGDLLSSVDKGRQACGKVGDVSKMFGAEG